MTYRINQLESRNRYLAAYDASEVSKYDAWISAMTATDHDACVADLRRCVTFQNDMTVLDAGSGTGALCLALVRIGCLRITALEPCSTMTDAFRSKPELKNIATVCGFCDHPDDQRHFDAESFDLIASRQLTNCLYDPLAAFRNWYYWLRPSGTLVVMDGLFNRDDWSGKWESMVDDLPLSACRTIATVPYLLEQVGFRVDSAGPMRATNGLASTRTSRYIVTASKSGS